MGTNGHIRAGARGAVLHVAPHFMAPPDPPIRPSSPAGDSGSAGRGVSREGTEPTGPPEAQRSISEKVRVRLTNNTLVPMASSVSSTRALCGYSDPSASLHSRYSPSVRRGPTP